MKKLFFILIVAVFSACERNPDSPASEKLMGKWNWVKSSGGINGKVQTPASTGKNVVLEFSASKIKIYENGILQSERSYTIQTKNSITGGQKEMLVYEPFRPDQTFVIENQQLFLSDECADCYQSEYQRP